MNELSAKLGLRDDDLKRQAKLHRLCADLGSKVLTPLGRTLNWRYTDADLSTTQGLAADLRHWSEFGARQVWSKKQGHTWFAAEVNVPPEAAGKTLVLRFSSQWQERPGTTDPQCLAYLDGQIAQAIDGNHTELVIARNAKPKATYSLLIDAFTFFDRPLVGLLAEFMVRNERVEKLYFDLQTPLEVACLLAQTDGRRHAILDRVEASLLTLDRRDGVTPEFENSLAEAELLAAEIYALGDTEAQPIVSAVGHTHLDVGWLWRVKHTRDKTGRSFATALALMDEYPDFVFMYNQSVLFNFLMSDYPELWEKVRAKANTGQFEIEGAMWVEPDANLISGESMVRQIMHGRRFHLQQFGVSPKVVWLPDTFGYSANLPQIMARSGLEYFVTSKLSWNDTNRHPYDTFFWRGIDGTTIKAYLITAQRFENDAIFTTYNSDLSVSEVMGAWKRYEPKAVNDEVLICYGYGDGGGGPTRAMIERGRRLQRGIPGAPRLKLEGVVPFFDRLGRRMNEDEAAFPVWHGELYLEYHRGTLTSVAKNKANNRQAERILRELEFLSSMAIALTPDTKYPTEELQTYWELVLINQFHDILPGTSIEEVYEDSDAEYGEIFADVRSAGGLWYSAANLIAKPESDTLVLFNFTGQSRDGELVRIEGPGITGAVALSQGGASHRLQEIVSADGSTRRAAPVASLPSLGWSSAALVEAAGEAQPSSLSVSTGHLENDLLRVRFDPDGEIVSVVDKASGRELIAVGKTGNRLVAYEDKPLKWDAWDIDPYFEERSWALSATPASITVVESGPFRAAIRIERGYSNSKISQVVSLEERARQIDFDTFVDWRERQTVLKALFPFDMNTTDIRSEIQFGHVRRATHRNTSWDRARFEASMHRWVDMSEPNFGAALLNDCKYGYDAVEQLVRLTLMRGSIFPNPDADIGEHRFKYALMIHDGLADLADVHRAAERFNSPISVVGDTSARSDDSPNTRLFCFAEVDRANITLETVKKAEAGGALVLRVFEHANMRTLATIKFGLPVKSVRATNLMEEGGVQLEVIDNSVVIGLAPFEIATLMIDLG